MKKLLIVVMLLGVGLSVSGCFLTTGKTATHTYPQDQPIQW